MGAVELFGRYQVGERCWVEGAPHRVTAVVRSTLWDSDRIDDEDEFGRAPGWYTEAEVEPDTLTPEEAAQAAAREAERRARRDGAAAARRAYEADLAAAAAAVEALVAAHGLVPAPEGATGLLLGTTGTRVGWAAEPDRGISCVTEGAVYRDADGVVAGASLGCPVDLGPRYWVTPERAAAGLDKKRIWQWWNPTGYGADSYPGPGVPVEELSPGERAEVDRLTAAAVEEVARKERRSAELDAERCLETLGLVRPSSRWASPGPLSPDLLRGREVRFDPEAFGRYCTDLYHHQRTRGARRGDRPWVRGVALVITLAPAAFAGHSPRSRKPAPADLIRSPFRAHDCHELPIVVLRAQG